MRYIVTAKVWRLKMGRQDNPAKYLDAVGASLNAIGATQSGGTVGDNPITVVREWVTEDVALADMADWARRQNQHAPSFVEVSYGAIVQRG